MALVGYFGLSERRRAGAFWAAGGSLALLALTVIQLVIPGLNRYFIRPPQILSYAAGLNLTPTDRLIVYGSTRPSNVFYARRKVLFVAEGLAGDLQIQAAGRSRDTYPSPETTRLSLARQSVDGRHS
jgi:hypothetical protein